MPGANSARHSRDIGPCQSGVPALDWHYRVHSWFNSVTHIYQLPSDEIIIMAIQSTRSLKLLVVLGDKWHLG